MICCDNCCVVVEDERAWIYVEVYRGKTDAEPNYSQTLHLCEKCGVSLAVCAEKLVIDYKKAKKEGALHEPT